MLEASCDRCKKKFQKGFRLMLIPEVYSARGIISQAMDNRNFPHERQLCPNCREDLEVWLQAPVHVGKIEVKEKVYEPHDQIPCPRCSGSATMYTGKELAEHLINVHGANV